MKHATIIALCMSIAMPVFAEETPAKETPATEPPAKETPAKPDKPDLKGIFKKKDKDGDGFLSKEEFVPKKAKDPSKLETAFTRKDTNGDGKLSEEEFAAQGKHKKK